MTVPHAFPSAATDNALTKAGASTASVGGERRVERLPDVAADVLAGDERLAALDVVERLDREV
jgi:hypothetical protein